MMNIEKFIDQFGDDVYALALVCTKNFDSAAEVFLRTAEECGGFPENADIRDIVSAAFPFCRNAKCTDTAETLSQAGLTKKQEALLAEFFPKPQVIRAIVHMHFENDLSAEQISELLHEKPRYVSEQLDALGLGLTEELENSYKGLCLKLCAPDELKSEAVIAAKSGKKRIFEVEEEPMPTHSWSKNQKIAAVILAVVVTIALMIVIPIVNQLIDGYFLAESQEEIPSDWIFSYNSEAEDVQSIE